MEGRRGAPGRFEKSIIQRGRARCATKMRFFIARHHARSANERMSNKIPPSWSARRFAHKRTANTQISRRYKFGFRTLLYFFRAFLFDPKDFSIVHLSGWRFRKYRMIYEDARINNVSKVDCTVWIVDRSYRRWFNKKDV